MTKAFFFILLILWASTPAESSLPLSPCEENTVKLSKDYFITGVDFQALAEQMRPELVDKPSRDRKYFPVELKDGKTSRFQVTKVKKDEFLLFLYGPDGGPAAHMRFKLKDPTTLYIMDLNTHFLSRGAKASDALIQLAFALYPEVKTCQAALADTNLEVIAETIAGKKLRGSADHETVLKQATQEHRYTEIKAAVEESPTGKSLKRLGFVLDSQQLEFTGANDTWDNKAQLAVQWSRPN